MTPLQQSSAKDVESSPLGAIVSASANIPITATNLRIALPPVPLC
jgi:hypothetical protein